jgi:hypothetical protein
METVKTEVRKLSKHWERTVKDKSSADPGIFLPPTNVSSPGSVLPRPSAGGQAEGPNGHRSDLWNRGPRYGSVTYTRSWTRVRPIFLLFVLLFLNRMNLWMLVEAIPLENCLSLISLLSLVIIRGYGCLDARITLTCIMLRSLYGFRWRLCI